MAFKDLVIWSENEFSDLPWRKNRTLFSTLVSEIMLQQTTVGTVLNHYPSFMKKLNSIEKIAKLSESEMTKAWKGLGYYRRARHLKKACEMILKDFKGVIPLDPELLKSISGIGDYTAHAILSVGADLNYLSIDANLERVIARLYFIDIPKGPKLIKEIYKRFNEGKILSSELKKFGGRIVNEALMDLGRNICKARNPKCEKCFLKNDCLSFKVQRVSDIPQIVENKKTKKYFTLSLLRLVCLKDNKILLYQKNQDEWVAGQWEIPTLELNSEDKSLKQYLKISGNLSDHFDFEFKSGITKYEIMNYVQTIDINELKKIEKIFRDRKLNWFDLKTIKNKNVTTITLKILEKLKYQEEK
jgi:A/G-specific adenine glycosylase